MGGSAVKWVLNCVRIIYSFYVSNTKLVDTTYSAELAHWYRFLSISNEIWHIWSPLCFVERLKKEIRKTTFQYTCLMRYHSVVIEINQQTLYETFFLFFPLLIFHCFCFLLSMLIKALGKVIFISCIGICDCSIGKYFCECPCFPFRIHITYFEFFFSTRTQLWTDEVSGPRNKHINLKKYNRIDHQLFSNNYIKLVIS